MAGWDNRTMWERWVDRFRTPCSVTALIPVADLSEELLDRRLQTHAEQVRAALSRRHTIHALRLVAVPGSDQSGGSRVLVNVVYDGSYTDVLNDMEAVLAPVWSDVLPAKSAPQPHRHINILQRHRVPDSAFFVASCGISVGEIRQEAHLRAVLREWVVNMGPDKLGRLDPRQARYIAREHVQSLEGVVHQSAPGEDWLRKLARHTNLLFALLCFPTFGVLFRDMTEAVERARPVGTRWLVRAGYALWWLYAAIPVAVAFVWVRIVEWMEEHPPPPTPDSEQVRRIEVVEDSRPKNELTVWFPVRPTRMGRLLMRVVLYGSELGTRHLWTNGRLAGAENIHFARLVLVDQAQTMVFMSDYQGSFDGYIEHFIGVGGRTRAVVPISSRLEGCPETRWLYNKVDPPAFRQGWRQLIRAHQRQAAIRYVAYEGLSANDIIQNRRIRQGLFADRLSAAEEDAWPRLI